MVVVVGVVRVVEAEVVDVVVIMGHSGRKAVVVVNGVAVA